MPRAARASPPLAPPRHATRNAGRHSLGPRAAPTQPTLSPAPCVPAPPRVLCCQARRWASRQAQGRHRGVCCTRSSPRQAVAHVWPDWRSSTRPPARVGRRASTPRRLMHRPAAACAAHVVPSHPSCRLPRSLLSTRLQAHGVRLPMCQPALAWRRRAGSQPRHRLRAAGAQPSSVQAQRSQPTICRPTNRCIRRAQPPPRSTPCIVTATLRVRRASLACRAHEPRASAACGRRGTCVLAAAVATTRATQRGPAARDAPRSPPARAAQAPAIARVADASQRHVGMSVACGAARRHQARGPVLLLRSLACKGAEVSISSSRPRAVHPAPGRGRLARRSDHSLTRRSSSAGGRWATARARRRQPRTRSRRSS